MVLPPSTSRILYVALDKMDKALSGAWLLVVVKPVGAILVLNVGTSFKAVTSTEELLVPAAKLAVAFAAPLLSVMLAMSNTRKPGVGLSIFVFF